MTENLKTATVRQSVFNKLNLVLRPYRVLSKLHHDGETYEIGSEVELTTEQAGPLLDVGAVELAT